MCIQEQSGGVIPGPIYSYICAYIQSENVVPGASGWFNVLSTFPSVVSRVPLPTNVLHSVDNFISKMCNVLSSFNGTFLVTDKYEYFFIFLLISLQQVFSKLSQSLRVWLLAFPLLTDLLILTLHLSHSIRVYIQNVFRDKSSPPCPQSCTVHDGQTLRWPLMTLFLILGHLPQP